MYTNKLLKFWKTFLVVGVITFPLILSVWAGVEAEVRTWTNTDGKEIEAAFVSADEVEVIIEISGNEVAYPLAKLSVADQAWVSGILKALEEERASIVTGLQKGVKISNQLYDSTEEYFSEGVRASVLKSFENGAYSVSNPGTPDEWLARDPDVDTCVVYVPESYDGSEPYGIYVHVKPGETGGFQKEWLPLFDSMKLIAVSADKAGNKYPMLRRIRLSVDALATVEESYQIDPGRRIVGGLSGGGHMAMLTAAMFPELFLGAISHAAQSYFPVEGNYGHFPGMESRDFTKTERADKRWVVVSGDKDRNYREIKETGKRWVHFEMNYRFIDVPGMGHKAATAKYLGEAIRWVEAEEKTD